MKALLIVLALCSARRADPDPHQPLPPLPTMQDGSHIPIPPHQIQQDPPQSDRRMMYVGGGIVVLAAIFWWNRRRRDRFEQEDHHDG